MSIDIQFGVSCDISENFIKKWVSTTLQSLQTKGAVVIRIVSEEEITQLNKHYRKKPYPTNVLSFPCQLPPPLRKDNLGDIAICASVVSKEADEQHKPGLAHFAHIVVHGVLHLLGYDHENEKDAHVMEKIEISILSDLGFPNPYHPGVEILHE